MIWDNPMASPLLENAWFVVPLIIGILIFIVGAVQWIFKSLIASSDTKKKQTHGLIQNLSDENNIKPSLENSDTKAFHPKGEKTHD